MRHIVALRGDPAGGAGTRYEPHPDGYQWSTDLVTAVKAIGDFEVSVAAYPERHPESATLFADIDDAQAQGRCRGGPRHHPVLLR